MTSEHTKKFSGWQGRGQNAPRPRPLYIYGWQGQTLMSKFSFFFFFFFIGGGGGTFDLAINMYFFYACVDTDNVLLLRSH